MTDKIDGLPVAGYVAQGREKVIMVNSNKLAEEKLLRLLDELKADPEIDQRWLAIARTGFERAYMDLNRSIFKPERVRLEGDD